jgi:hypothetical protein
MMPLLIGCDINNLVRLDATAPFFFVSIISVVEFLRR